MRISQAFGLLATAVSTVSSQTCTTPFNSITASAAFAALNPGWNLGNTLDAVPNEGSWNNAPAQQKTLAQIAAKGFKSIRIPGICYRFQNQIFANKSSNVGLSLHLRLSNMDRRQNIHGPRRASRRPSISP